jgi:serine/threonine-protein kinase
MQYVALDSPQGPLDTTLQTDRKTPETTLPLDPQNVGTNESAVSQGGTISKVEVGTVLHGRYLIECRLGGGIWADVYRAHDLQHGRQVAIKVFSSDSPNPITSQRFLREIQTTARLNHPHLLPVYDSGATDGVIYYVTPLVACGSLRTLLDNEGSLPVGRTLKIMREVVDALAFAHERGVVHRDVKPDNVMWSCDHAQVGDFGIAKALKQTPTSRISMAGIPLGTPSYMAPEQVIGHDTIDHRADIYAVGALMYELIAGTPVFSQSTPELIMYAQLYETPPDITTHRKDIPRSVARMVMRCLEKDPRRRWQSARQLLAAIEAALAEKTSLLGRVARWISG